MKRKTAITMLLLVLGIMGAKANDGVYYTAGNQLVPLAETDISIKKEILTISLQDDGFAHVDVFYEFFNPGNAAKKVLMGFEADPSYNDDYTFHNDGRHPHIHDFTVEMNGTRLGYKNAVCEQNTPHGVAPLDMSKYELSEYVTTVHPKDNDTLYIPFSYVYYFDATFTPGLNKIHHTYRYKLSMSVGVCYSLSYKLSPATRWANKQIDDFTLIIKADNTAKHFVVNEKNFADAPWTVSEGVGKQRPRKHYDDTLREFSLRNGAFTWHKENFHPTEELQLYSADYLYSFNKDEKFGSFYDRTDLFGLDWSMDGNKFINEPKNRKKRARIAHNLPYAHRGLVFKNAEMRKYFTSLWWYMPDPSYVASQADFTAVDRKYTTFK